MQQKSFDFKKIIFIVAVVLCGLLAFRFFMPANCSALLQDAQSVTIRVSEKTSVDGYPEILSHEVTFEMGDRELIELKNLFTDYNCFFTLKQVDWSDGNMTIHDAPLSIYMDVTGGETVRNIQISGKYLVSGENVWKIGLNKQTAEDFQLRLYEFVLEHSED